MGGVPAVVSQVLDRVRQGLWFIPSLAVVAAAVAAGASIWASAQLPAAATGGGTVLPVSIGPEGARAMLQAVAGSVITVAGVTFSITVVALQLASTQFSPRVLRTFLRDRGNQIALGVFMATFTYSLLVLASVRSSDEGGGFVPTVGVVGTFALALLSIGTLVFFIHHISNQLQVTTILGDVAEETLAVLRKLWPEDREGANAPDGDDAVEGAARGTSRRFTVPAPTSGYLEYVAIDGLTDAARAAQARVRLVARPGAWVTRATPLFEVEADEAPDEELVATLQRHVGLGGQPSMQQNVAFGIRQLVDIAVRALSPGVNDPTTAVMCLNRIVEILTEAGRRREPRRMNLVEDGPGAVVVDFHDFAELVDLAFTQLRHYGCGDPVVARALSDAVARLERDLPSSRHAVIQRHAPPARAP